MSATDLKGLAQSVISRARSRGFVVPREVRAELAQAGVPDARWKEVLALARSHLSYRHGRYYYVSPLAARMHQGKRNQQQIQRAVRFLLRDYRQALDEQVERRQYRRFQFFRQVVVQTADGRELRLVSCDMSISGIHLVGAYNLQGQKVRLRIPTEASDGPSWCFLVHLLWAKEIGDKIFENGGIFVEVCP